MPFTVLYSVRGAKANSAFTAAFEWFLTVISLSDPLQASVAEITYSCLAASQVFVPLTVYVNSIASQVTSTLIVVAAATLSTYLALISMSVPFVPSLVVARAATLNDKMSAGAGSSISAIQVFTQ